ncbi:endo-1,4-beta-xylanase [Marisediminicola sp. LYQ85]|uniref:endo-1,4-beta-xylanase n=1 Tax=Marisediminicola sp. LYQ85 TaxID=3391062 RepID=UPI0039830A33
MAASFPPFDDSVRHRVVDATVTVVSPDGTPLADTDVVVEQSGHAFAFGNIGFDFIPLANGETEPVPGRVIDADIALLPRLADLWLDVFNTATLPFYWGRFEPDRGKPDTARLLATAQWFADRGVALKGHPLVWHTVTAPWLLELEPDEIERVQRERIRREVGDFRGLVDTWDAINEVVIMPVFEAEDNGITKLAKHLGRIPMIRLAFEEARAANPSVTLLLNDFDLSERYEDLLDEVLGAGIQIDAIGLQTHMHQGYWGEDTMLATVDKFARFGLPLHMTESTILSGDLMPPEIVDLNDYQVDHWPSTPEGEERQADEIVRHYRSLMTHPAVEAITYWGLSDSGSWLGAPVGFVRADGSTKPSYDALRSLVKEEWWMPQTTLRTDADGRVPVRGFAGDYRVSARGAETTVPLSGGVDARVTATLGRAS